MAQLNQSDMTTNTTQHTLGEKQDTRSGRIQMAGAFVGVLIFTTLLTLGSCSKDKSKPAAVAASSQAAVSTAANSSLGAGPTPQASSPMPTPKKTRRKRPSTFSYVNRSYGVSFSFPRQDRLKTVEKAKMNGDDPSPFAMNFVQPGGLTLAEVELPENSYPGTDFKSGMVKVSVNPAMTLEACSQFAFPDPSAWSPNDKIRNEKIGKVKIGALEFSEIAISSTSMRQTDAKYYHVFSNRTCYEFALGIGTEGEGNVEGVTPVDREAVFGKLEKILASVKLQARVLPDTDTPAPSAGATAPADSSKGPEGSANARNF